MNCGVNELWRLFLLTTLVPIFTQARHDEDLRPSLSCLLMGNFGCRGKCALLCKTYGCIDWNPTCDSVYCVCGEQWEPIVIEPDIVKEFEGLVDFDDVLAVKFKRTPVFIDLEETLYDNPDLMDEVMYFLRHTHGHGQPFKDQFRVTFPELDYLLKRLRPRPLKEQKGNGKSDVPNEPLGNLDPPTSRWGFLSDWWNKPSTQSNSKENKERIIDMVNGVEKKEDLLSTLKMLRDSGDAPLYTDVTKHFLKNGLIMLDGTRILKPISDSKALKKSLANDDILHAIEDKIKEEEEFKRGKKRRQIQPTLPVEKKPKIEPVIETNPVGNQLEESKSSYWGFPSWFSSKSTGSKPSEGEKISPEVSLSKVKPSDHKFDTGLPKPSNTNNKYLPHDDLAESIYDDGYYSETSQEYSWPEEKPNSLPTIQQVDGNYWNYGNPEPTTQTSYNELEYSSWPENEHYMNNQFDNDIQQADDIPRISTTQSDIASTEPDWFNFSWEQDIFPISPVEEEFLKKEIPQTNYESSTPQLGNKSYSIDTPFTNVKVDQPTLTDSSQYFFGDHVHPQETNPKNTLHKDHQEVIPLPDNLDLESSASDESSDGRNLNFFLNKQQAEEPLKQINNLSSTSTPITIQNVSQPEESDENEPNTMLQNLLKLANVPVNDSMPNEEDTISIGTRNLGYDRGFDELQFSNDKNKSNSPLLDDSSTLDEDYIIERTHLNRLHGIIPESSESIEYIPVKKIIRKKKKKPTEEIPNEEALKEKVADKLPVESVNSSPQSLTSIQFEGSPGSPILQIDGLPGQQYNPITFSTGGAFPKLSEQPYNPSAAQEPKVKSTEKPYSHISEGLKNILPSYVTDNFSASIEDTNEAESETYITDSNRDKQQSPTINYKPGTHIPTNMTEGSTLPKETLNISNNPLSKYTEKLNPSLIKDMPSMKFNTDVELTPERILSSKPSNKVSQGSQKKSPTNKNSILKSLPKIPTATGSKKSFGLPQPGKKVSNLEENPLRNNVDAEDLNPKENPNLLGNEMFTPELLSSGIMNPLSDTKETNLKFPQGYSEMKKNPIKTSIVENPLTLNDALKISNNNKIPNLLETNQVDDNITENPEILTNQVIKSPENIQSKNKSPIPKTSSTLGIMPDINLNESIDDEIVPHHFIPQSNKNSITLHADPSYTLDKDQEFLIPDMEEEITPISLNENTLDKNNTPKIVDRPMKTEFPKDKTMLKPSQFDIQPDFDKSEPVANILSAGYKGIPKYDNSESPVILSSNGLPLAENPLSREIVDTDIYNPRDDEKNSLSPSKTRITDTSIQPQITNPASKYISKPINPSRTAKNSDRKMPSIQEDRKKKMASTPPLPSISIPGKSNIKPVKNMNSEPEMPQRIPNIDMSNQPSLANLKNSPDKKKMTISNPLSQNSGLANPYQPEYQNGDKMQQLALPGKEHLNGSKNDMDLNDSFIPLQKTIGEKDNNLEDEEIDLSSFLGLYDEKQLDDLIDKPSNKIGSNELPGNNHHTDDEDIFGESNQADLPIHYREDKYNELPNKNGSKGGISPKIENSAPPTSDNSLFADDSNFDDFFKLSANPITTDSYYSENDNPNPTEQKQLEDLDEISNNEQPKGTVSPNKLDNFGSESNSILTNVNDNPLAYKVYDEIKPVAVPNHVPYENDKEKNPNKYFNSEKNQQPFITNEINSPQLSEEPDFDDFFKYSSSPSTNDIKPEDNDFDLNMFLGIDGLDEFKDLIDNDFKDEKRKNEAADLDDFSGMDDSVDDTKSMPIRTNILTPQDGTVNQPSTTTINSSKATMEPNANKFIKVLSDTPPNESDGSIDSNLFSTKDGINMVDNLENDLFENYQQNEENSVNKLADLTSVEDFPDDFGDFDLPNKYRQGTKKKIPSDLNHTDKNLPLTNDKPSLDNFNGLVPHNIENIDDFASVEDFPDNFGDFDLPNKYRQGSKKKIPSDLNHTDKNLSLTNDKPSLDNFNGLVPHNTENIDDFASVEDFPDNFGDFDLPNKYKQGSTKKVPSSLNLTDKASSPTSDKPSFVDFDGLVPHNTENIDDFSSVEDFPDDIGEFDLPNKYKQSSKKKIPSSLNHTDKIPSSTGDKPSFDNFNGLVPHDIENDNILESDFNWSSFPGVDNIHDLNNIIDNDSDQEKQKSMQSSPPSDDFFGLSDLPDNKNQLDDKTSLPEAIKGVPKMPTIFTPTNLKTVIPSQNTVDDFQSDSTYNSDDNAGIPEFPFLLDKKSKNYKNRYLPNDLSIKPEMDVSKLADDSAKTSTFEELIPQAKVTSEHSPESQRLPSDFMESVDDEADDVPSITKLFPNLLLDEEYFPSESSNNKQLNEHEDVSDPTRIPNIDSSPLPDGQSGIYTQGDDMIPYADSLIDENSDNLFESVDNYPTNLKNVKLPNKNSDIKKSLENSDDLNLNRASNNFSSPPANIYREPNKYLEFPKINELSSSNPLTEEIPNNVKMNSIKNPKIQTDLYPTVNRSNLHDSAIPTETEDILENNLVFPSENLMKFPNSVEGIETSSVIPPDEQFPFIMDNPTKQRKNSDLFRNQSEIPKHISLLENEILTGDDILEFPEEHSIPDDILASISEAQSNFQTDAIKPNLASFSPELTHNNFLINDTVDTQPLVNQIDTPINSNQDTEHDNKQWDSLLERLPFLETDNAYSTSVDNIIPDYSSNKPLNVFENEDLVSGVEVNMEGDNLPLAVSETTLKPDFSIPQTFSGKPSMYPKKQNLLNNLPLPQNVLELNQIADQLEIQPQEQLDKLVENESNNNTPINEKLMSQISQNPDDILAKTPSNSYVDSNNIELTFPSEPTTLPDIFANADSETKMNQPIINSDSKMEGPLENKNSIPNRQKPKIEKGPKKYFENVTDGQTPINNAGNINNPTMKKSQSKPDNNIEQSIPSFDRDLKITPSFDGMKQFPTSNLSKAKLEDEGSPNSVAINSDSKMNPINSSLSNQWPILEKNRKKSSLNKPDAEITPETSLNYPLNNKHEPSESLNQDLNNLPNLTTYEELESQYSNNNFPENLDDKNKYSENPASNPSHPNIKNPSLGHLPFEENIGNDYLKNLAHAVDSSEDTKVSPALGISTNSNPLEKNIKSNLINISENEGLENPTFPSLSAGKDISDSLDNITFSQDIGNDAISPEEPWEELVIQNVDPPAKLNKAKKIYEFESGDLDSAEEELLQQMMKDWSKNKETPTKMQPIVMDDSEISLLPGSSETNNLDNTSPNQILYSTSFDSPPTNFHDDINTDAPYIPSDQIKAAKEKSKILDTPDQVLSKINTGNYESQTPLQLEDLPTKKPTPSINMMNSEEPFEEFWEFNETLPNKKQEIETIPDISQVADDSNMLSLMPIIDRETSTSFNGEQETLGELIMKNNFDLETPNNSNVLLENNLESSAVSPDKFLPPVTPSSTYQLPPGRQKPAKFQKIMDILNPESVNNKKEKQQNNAEDVLPNLYEPVIENPIEAAKTNQSPEIPNDIRFAIDNETGEISSIVVPAQNINTNKAPIIDNKKFLDDTIIEKEPLQYNPTLPVDLDDFMGISNNELENESKTPQLKFSEANDILPESPMSLMDILKLNDMNRLPESSPYNDSNNPSAGLPDISKFTIPTANHKSDDKFADQSKAPQQFTEPSLPDPPVSLMDILKPNNPNIQPEFNSNDKLDNESAYLSPNVNISDVEPSISNQVDTPKQQFTKESEISPEPAMSLIDILKLNNVEPSEFNFNDELLNENLAVPSNEPVTSLPTINSSPLINNQQKPSQVVRPTMPKSRPSNSQPPLSNNTSDLLKKKNDINANAPNVVTPPKVKAPSANLESIITKAEPIPQSAAPKPPTNGLSTLPQSLKKLITPRPVQMPTQTNKAGPQISPQNDSNTASPPKKPMPDNVQQKINDLMNSFPEEAEGSLSSDPKIDESLIFGLGQPTKPKPIVKPANDNTKPLRNTNSSLNNNQSPRPTQPQVPMNSKPQTPPVNSKPPPANSKPPPANSKPPPANSKPPMKPSPPVSNNEPTPNNLSAKTDEFDYNDPFSIFVKKESIPVTNSIPSSQVEKVPKFDFDGFGDLDILAGEDKFTEQELMLAAKNPKVRPDILMSAQNTGNTNPPKAEKPPKPSFAMKKA